MVCPGCTVDLGSAAVWVRGTTYQDDTTNIYTLHLLSDTVVSTRETQPQHEFEQGAYLGLVIAPILVFVLYIRRYFARGDAFE